MPRDQVYQLRLTKEEKAELARIAKSKGMSIARLIRRRCLEEEGFPSLKEARQSLNLGAPNFKQSHPSSAELKAARAKFEASVEAEKTEPTVARSSTAEQPTFRKAFEADWRKPDLSQRITQLFHRGMTTRQAKRQAEAEINE